MLDSLADFVGLSSTENQADPKSDDANLLPIKLVPIYKNPYRAFGLDENSADIASVRDAFRKQVLCFVDAFSDLGRPKMDLKQLVFAYHLIRKNISGPAGKLKNSLDTNPYLDFRPEDILPLLRPKNSPSFPCSHEYRGFRMLNVVCNSSSIQYSLTMEKTQLPVIVFKFDVHYCLRRHHIEKDYAAVKQLHNQLSSELLTLPAFPEITLYQILGLTSRDYLGNLLGEYIMRIHNMLANKGMFCPRLLKFLGIDFERVHSEEEGILISLLDTSTLPPSSAYHMISEEWLVKWRKFVMGRGARRYFPPGRITNEFLAAECSKEGRKDLKISIHYRAVNYNVWKLYKLVHGGGPCISRLTDNIYSSYCCSLLQGAIMIQTQIRVYLAKLEKERKYVKELSHCKTARAVMYEVSKKRLQHLVQDKIKTDQIGRKKEKMLSAVQATQSMWRKKKGYVPEVNLRREKLDQEVFAKTLQLIPDDDNAAISGQVVETQHPIIHFGNTFMYTRVISEEVGINFKTKRVPGTQSAMLWDCLTPTEFFDGSKIISINSHPCSALTYAEIKDKLVSTPWPVVLELERPFTVPQLPSLDSIICMEDLTLQYNAFKILLKFGLRCLKHNRSNNSYHPTIIKLTENEMMYRSRSDPKKTEDEMWQIVPLFDVKFVMHGGDSKTIVTKAKKNKRDGIDPDCCFEIVNEDRGLLVEIPLDEVFEEMWAEDQAIYERNDRDKNSAELKIATETAMHFRESRKIAEEYKNKYLDAIRYTQREMAKFKIAKDEEENRLKRLSKQKKIDKKNGTHFATKREKRGSIFFWNRSTTANTKNGNTDVGADDFSDDNDNQEIKKLFARNSSNVIVHNRRSLGNNHIPELAAFNRHSQDGHEEQEGEGEGEEYSGNIVRFNPRQYCEDLKKPPNRFLRVDDIDCISPEELYMKIKAATTIRLFKKLVDEIRKVQIHIDENGLAVRRTQAKTSLRKV